MIIMIMSKTFLSSLTKKEYFKLREVEKLYKIINKYNLRQQAYKSLLQMYIKFKKGNQ